MSRLESKTPLSDSAKQLLAYSLEIEGVSNAADLDTGQASLLGTILPMRAE